MKQIVKRGLILFEALLICFYMIMQFYFSDIGDFKVNAEDDFKTSLANLLDREPTDRDIHSFSLAITTLREDGLPDAAIAGILGNIRAESMGLSYIAEGYMGSSPAKDLKTGETITVAEMQDYGEYELGEPSWYSGGGHGIVQWSFDRATNFIKFSEENKKNYAYVTVHHVNIINGNRDNKHVCTMVDMAGQLVFVLSELNGDYSYVKTSLLQVTGNTESDALEAGRIFENKYEVSRDGFTVERQSYSKKALPVVKSCTSVQGSGGSPNLNGANDVGQLATDLLGMGLWSEDQFADFVSLNELTIMLPNRDNLKYNQVHEISEWKQTIDRIKYDRAYRLPRQIFMFIGIIITVYSTLLYVAFQLDRVNNFIDVSLLSILTFKRFQASYDDKLSNFADTSKSQKILAHRDIIKVSLTGILIGVLLLSGKLFNLVALVIAWITEKIG